MVWFLEKVKGCRRDGALAAEWVAIEIDGSGGAPGFGPAGRVNGRRAIMPARVTSSVYNVRVVARSGRF